MRRRWTAQRGSGGWERGSRTTLERRGAFESARARCARSLRAASLVWIRTTTPYLVVVVRSIAPNRIHAVYPHRALFHPRFHHCSCDSARSRVLFRVFLHDAFDSKLRFQSADFLSSEFPGC